MKRKIKLLLLLMLCCGLLLAVKYSNLDTKAVFSIGSNNSEAKVEIEDQEILNLIEDYERNIKNFTPLSVDEIYDKINNEDAFYIYVGRVTCEWCRLFVPILNEYSIEQNIHVYYLDSTDTETNSKLKNFREINNIDYVPAFLYYSNGTKLHKFEFDITNEEFDKEEFEKIISNDMN